MKRVLHLLMQIAWLLGIGQLFLFGAMRRLPMTPPGIAIIHMEKSSILNMPNKHPPKPKSLYHYLSPDIKKSLTPEAIKLSKRTPVVINQNIHTPGNYNPNTGIVNMRNGGGLASTHEFIHALDFGSKNMPS